MKISVIMIDGSFRENTFGANSFPNQDFPHDQYEVLWVEYYGSPNPNVQKLPNIKILALNRDGIYHSSHCFNKGITEAQGEIIVIPDADQIVRTNFLSTVWELHSKYDKLVVYGYRYDEICKGTLKSIDFKELEDKCILKNPLNYGGCLTVRKKWLDKVNGYEQHPIFRTGYHANGLDMYTRLKNLGLAIQWEPKLKLYHPWHPFTLSDALEYKIQKYLIEWRRNNLQWKAFQGIDSKKNAVPPEDIAPYLKMFTGKRGRPYRRLIRKSLIRASDYIINRSNRFKRHVFHRI